MLFELWQNTLRRSADEVAWLDVASRVHLTFRDLDDRVKGRAPNARGTLIPASTREGALEFVIQTLCAWRDAGVLIPYESQCPNLAELEGLPEGIAHVKLTSGSTGHSRFILFREEQLLADFQNIRSTMGFDAPHPNLGVISVAHSYGFSHLILPLLLMGKPLWHVANPLPESMRSAFARGQPLFLPAVPAMWRAWSLAGLLKNAPIHLAMSAGAPLHLELEAEVYNGCGLKIHNFYGASECGGIAYDRTLVPRSDASDVGTALDGVSLGLHADGCMVVRGANVGVSYWPIDPEDQALVDGCFTASDLVELGAEGVRLIGRQTDSINVAGRKVPPGEIESVLLSSPRVRHCVVFGVPSEDPSRVEDIVACVHGDENLLSADLTRLVSGCLRSWQIPRKWWLTQDLNPNERGKISRAQWKELFLLNADRC
jgi:long-chain acyl-CoA synthetase